MHSERRWWPDPAPGLSGTEQHAGLCALPIPPLLDPARAEAHKARGIPEPWLPDQSHLACPPTWCKPLRLTDVQRLAPPLSATGPGSGCAGLSSANRYASLHASVPTHRHQAARVRAEAPFCRATVRGEGVLAAPLVQGREGRADQFSGVRCCHCMLRAPCCLTVGTACPARVLRAARTR